MLKKLIFPLFISIILFFASIQPSFAQEAQQPQQEEVIKAQVIQITDEGEQEIEGNKLPFQSVKVKLLEGSEKGSEVTIEHGKMFTIREQQKVQAGETVVVVKYPNPEGFGYLIVDKYRLDKLVYIALLFFALVIALSRWKGLGSLLGLIISLAVIVKFIVPQILLGHDPLVVSIIGALLIMVTTIYLAHGFSKKTTIALVSTFLSLVLTGVLAVLFANLVKLTGLGSEDAYSLQFGQTGNINFKGLLLGGIIIGTLGVLDDITTSLATAISELVKANPKAKVKELIKSGLTIGSEHISSLVNTLVLAYAGVGLPMFLFIVLNPTGQPVWFILNSEMIVEELVRTLAGSIGLVMAVPITTILAAYALAKGRR